MSHDDLELRLRAWMEAAAPAREPTGLVERSLSEVERTRQRPAHLAAPGLSAPRWPSPSLAALRPALLLLLLVALAAAAVGVGARLLVGDGSPVERLVFVEDGDVYTAAEDGSGRVRVLDGDLTAACGGYVGNRGLVSPDGSHIAVRTDWNDFCTGSVVIIDAHGEVLATVPGVGWDIAWSPDGGRFATWLAWEPEELIGIYDLEGRLLATLDGSVVCCGDYDPRWAPDGTALIVPAGDRVARLPLDGAEPELLASDHPLSRRPASVSPNGSVAAYVDDDGSFVVSGADGSGPRGLLDGSAMGSMDQGWWSSPVWSAQSDLVAVSMPTALLVLEPSSAGVATVARGLPWPEPIAFSASRERILVAHQHEGDDPVWMSVAVDGSGSTTLLVRADAADWYLAPGEEVGPVSP